MLQGREKRFFPGSYAYLGKLSNGKFSEQRVVVENFVEEKDRWVVKLWKPQFNGEKILVRENHIFFECYAVPCNALPELPSHLRVSPTGDCGNALFCNAEWDCGEIIMEEAPLMIVANRGGDSNFESRWQLYFALDSERGAKSPVLTAFREMADGGKEFVKDYLDDGKAMFKKAVASGGRSSEEVEQFCRNMPDFVQEEAERIAGVLSRWQTNSHNFATADVDQSGLFRWASKMQHSCEPNCILTVDSETGICITKTIKRISPGDQLCNDYMGGDPVFHAKDVKERRAVLWKRGFECACPRCKRESGEAE
jgi:hypothetical protein